MGCTQSIDVIRPNLFQTKLCMHHKTPVTDVYRSLGELGRGAFGVVEKVEHLKTHRHYAMKTVRFESGSKRHEFEKEMGILRVLHHPNIVRMLETFEDDHHFYIIMEFSSGGTLLDRVKTRNKEFPEDEAKDIIRNLASVIQYLHSRNICHRDLKLENILVETLDNGGHIKLCDFGASTLFKSGASMRKVLGSVVYMAPEVLEGNYKETCDMWSLGVIMYMLLSNKAPFYGHTDDELVESIFAGEVKYNGKVWDTISPEAKALLRKLLHRAALVAMAFCMSSEQVALHAAVYNELNVAHNGQLKLQELYLSPALIPFQLDLEKIFAALDQQHENGINLLEFVAATISPEDAADEELLLSTFYVLDRSHRGAITKDDLKALLGQHFDVSECQEMINKADADKDGQVNYNDFVKMMKLPTLNGKTTRVSFTQRRSSARRQSGISDGSVPNAPLTDTKEDTIQPSAGPETIEVELPEVTV
ncbi:Calcium-dependent protein kinase 34 [Phytophthora nicotianae]|uniref:non-specific serine/threonine protein kinase n=1 Tax=Phytophthora nicotianae TaxID=4792 RepID=A0A0W8CB95_PHYNI|nr:Calcium-dependent protein kinase 34 [Phytophthora nicotianae]